MKLNRKSVIVGFAGLGLAGLLTGGAGIAAAAATATPAPATVPGATAPAYGQGNGIGVGVPVGDRVGIGDRVNAGNRFGSASDVRGTAPGVRGMGLGENSGITAAAGYLGLSQTELQTKLQAGETLADVAGAQGKSVAGLESAIETAMRSHLDANTALTEEQRAARVAQIETHIDTMLTATHQPGAGGGPVGTRMGGRGR